MPTERPMIIPEPKVCEKRSGEIKIPPHICCKEAQWSAQCEAFCQAAKNIFDVDFTEGCGGIEVIRDDSLAAEHYVLDIEKQVTVYAPDMQALSYAFATVLQLAGLDLSFECQRIEDHADKPYRALFADLARKWHPFPTLLHYVDICYYYKLSYIHLHFMDDQGYRLPSAKFPNLPAPGRSYTFEEIETLRAYASARGVHIIPEIEMPGHATSLTAAYPDLFGDTLDTDSDEVMRTESGIVVNRKACVCAGSEVTESALQALIDEVIALFPESQYLHLGGDEVNTAVWKQCATCRAYMQKHNIQSPAELYCEFTARMTNYVLSKGKTPIIWEGFSKQYSHMISRDVVVISWENHYQNTNDLLEGGFKIINFTWQPNYIIPSITHNDWNVKSVLDWSVYEWQHWWPKSDAYLNPIRIAPTDAVLGAQLGQWECYYEFALPQMVEKLAALSERTWNIKRRCTYDDFLLRLDTQLKKLYALIANR